MKQLKKWVGKEVELDVKGTFRTYTYQGYVYRYKKSITNDTIEYWIGYDGGFMTEIKPKDVIRIEEIKNNDWIRSLGW